MNSMELAKRIVDELLDLLDDRSGVSNVFEMMDRTTYASLYHDLIIKANAVLMAAATTREVNAFGAGQAMRSG